MYLLITVVITRKIGFLLKRISTISNVYKHLVYNTETITNIYYYWKSLLLYFCIKLTRNPSNRATYFNSIEGRSKLVAKLLSNA